MTQANGEKMRTAVQQLDVESLPAETLRPLLVHKDSVVILLTCANNELLLRIERARQSWPSEVANQAAGILNEWSTAWNEALEVSHAETSRIIAEMPATATKQ